MANHDNALFLSPEEGVHDGCFRIVAAKSEAEIAALNERLANLPEPSAWFVAMTQKMAALPDSKKVLAIGKKTAKKGGDVLTAE